MSPSQQPTGTALRVGLLLRILGGWATPETLSVKLGVARKDVRQALSQLVGLGYAEVADDEDVMRWLPWMEFEDLWGTLIPDRDCPVSLRKERASA